MRNKYWLVAIGKDCPVIRFAHADSVYGAMLDAYGMKAESVSVRVLPRNPGYMSQKRKTAEIKDFSAKHLNRIREWENKTGGRDRLVLPGLQRQYGTPNPEDFVV